MCEFRSIDTDINIFVYFVSGYTRHAFEIIAYRLILNGFL